MHFSVDRIHSLPRKWSNRELKEFAHLFSGNIVNVSAWKDEDKEGQRYEHYFVNSSQYTLTNYKSEARGFQGLENEIFLDLEEELSSDLMNQFDVVFNHTTLEHIFDLHTAFQNLCKLSNDIVILITPFLQQYHSNYGDYWRISPLAIKKLFEGNEMELVYQSFNNHRMSSIYLFTIASKHPDKWKKHFDWEFSCEDPNSVLSEPYIGCNAIPNFRFKLLLLFKHIFMSPFSLIKRIASRLAKK